MTTKKILALPFPFVIHPWGRFHFFLLFIGLHQTKIQRPRWNIFISVAYLRCVPLSQFLVNGQQWERYVTTHPNPSPRKKKDDNWAVEDQGTPLADQKTAEDVWEYSAPTWKIRRRRLSVCGSPRCPTTTTYRTLWSPCPETAVGYWEKGGNDKVFI